MNHPTWPEAVSADTQHFFTAETAEGPMTIMAQLRSVSDTRENAEECAAVAFRAMLDMAGIPWRRPPKEDVE